MIAATALALLALYIDYATICALVFGMEPRVFGRRIPFVSFLGALFLSELPVWCAVAVKGLLLAIGIFLGLLELWIFPHLLQVTILATVWHVWAYIRVAYEARWLAEKTIAKFSDEGPLNEKDGALNWENPISIIWDWCLHPAPPHTAYGLEEFADICYGTAEEVLEAGKEASYLTLNVYRRVGTPSNARNPVLVEIHGGAWRKMLGAKENRVPIAFHMAAQGFIVVKIDYRLFPDNFWPDYIIDCKRAIRWIKQNIEFYGGDPEFIIVSGGSAGGHLVSLVAISGCSEYRMPEWQPGFEDVDTSVQAAVPLYPACDTSGEWWSYYTGKPFDKKLHEQASPVHHVMQLSKQVAMGDSRHELCPILIVQGAADSLTPAKFIRKFFKELNSHGLKTGICEYLEFPNAHHSFDLISSPRTYYTCGVVARFSRHVHELFLEKRRKGELGKTKGTKEVTLHENNTDKSRLVLIGMPPSLANFKVIVAAAAGIVLLASAMR